MFRLWKKSPLPLRFSAPRSNRPLLEELESRITPYSMSGNSWSHPELIALSFVPDGTTWGPGKTSNLFAAFDGSGNFESTAAWEHEILRAAQVWAEQANINFTVVSDNGQTLGQGSYQQGDPNHGDIRFGGYNFGIGTQPIAQAYMPPPVNNYDIAGDIKFNTAKYFTIGTTYDLFTVAAHEIGHALGLYHSLNLRAIMFPTYTTMMTDLYSDDINGIRAIYGARPSDSYDAAASNGSFATASDITATINGTTETATLTGLDITTQSDVDYYKFAAPTGTASTLQVVVQSQGLSLLMPAVTVYAADQTTVLGSAADTGYVGSTLKVTVNNVTAGQVFYVKVTGNEASAFGTGKYGLTLNFSTGANPTVPLPNTQTANGNPIHGGGGIAIEPGHEDHDDFPDPSAAGNAHTPATGEATPAIVVGGARQATVVSAVTITAQAQAITPTSARADGMVQVSLALIGTATAPTILPTTAPTIASVQLASPTTTPTEHTASTAAVALPASQVTTSAIVTDETPMPVVPAEDAAPPASNSPKSTPGVSEGQDQSAPSAAALDAFFTDEVVSVRQDSGGVEEGIRGPTLLASAGLALGWVGVWRGTAPRRNRRRLNIAERI